MSLSIDLYSGYCRFCGAHLHHLFADLGMSPLANSYVQPRQLNNMEPFYPLRAYVCTNCFLVQLIVSESPEQIFGNYAYFSSYSDSWLQHAHVYVEAMVTRFAFDHRSQIVEVGSNDGYLLQYFIEQNIPVLGIDPASNIAEVALRKGIPTRTAFFGQETACKLKAEGIQADLLIANNVLAHVPDLNDFVLGMKTILNPSGIITMEFPYLLRLIEGNQFDTIYHEHLSYFSFLTVESILTQHNLVVFDVEELPTHGGSLRIYTCHSENRVQPLTDRVRGLEMTEKAMGVAHLETYSAFNKRVQKTKQALLTFLIAQKQAGCSIAAYGAPAKGNTLLNFCGIRSDFIDYTVDRSPHKQGLFLPGTHIPIYSPTRISETKPDYVLILPWNLQEEIMHDLAYIRSWGGHFVVPIPEVQVY